MGAGVPATLAWRTARTRAGGLAFLLGVVATWLGTGAARAEAAVEDGAAAETEAPEKRRAPCPELEGPDAPTLESFRTGVERSVCVAAWYFDSLFGVLPENEIIESRRTHGRLRGGVEWNERDGFSEDMLLQWADSRRPR